MTQACGVQGAGFPPEQMQGAVRRQQAGHGFLEEVRVPVPQRMHREPQAQRRQGDAERGFGSPVLVRREGGGQAHLLHADPPELLLCAVPCQGQPVISCPLPGERSLGPTLSFSLSRLSDDLLLQGAIASTNSVLRTVLRI